jgi:hypothetical protein
MSDAAHSNSGESPMGFAEVMGPIGVAMGLDLVTMGPTQRGVLGLLRAGAELHRRLPEGPSGDAARTLLQRWGDLLLPTSQGWLQAVLDSARPTFDPAWILHCIADTSFAAGIRPAPMVAGLSVLIPPGLSQVGDAWRYIAAASTYMLNDDRDLSDVRGWLFGSAPKPVVDDVEAQLNAYAALGEIPTAIVAAVREAHGAWAVDLDSSDPIDGFEAMRRAVHRHALALEADASELGINPTLLGALRHLRDLAEVDRFSIAVLGEFKRGKSTLINALLGMPEFMPTSDLPWTMAVTEIRHGELRFELQPNPDEDRWESRSRAQYEDGVGHAYRHRRGLGQGERPPVQRWRLHAPSDFLADAFVEFVDTPGLNEDAEQDHIAQQRTNHSDNAIIMLHPSQLLSKVESELIESLRGRAENLALVINFGDEAKRPHQELVRYCVENIDAVGVPIDASRVVVVSARLAEEAMLRGEQDAWTAAMDQLRGVLRSQVLAKSVGRKRNRLATEITTVVPEARENANIVLVRREDKLRELRIVEQRVKNRETAAAEHAAAKRAIEKAAKHIAEVDGPTSALSSALFAAIPGITSAARTHEARWTSDATPVFSPKKHATEVAEKMKKDLLREVESWIKREGTEIVAKKMHEKLEGADADMEPVRRYLANALTLPDDEVKKMMDSLKRDAVMRAFDVPVDTGDAASVGMKVALMTVISLIVGYIIADVVLFYILAAISGFLNPVLLAATVVTAIAAYAFKGDEWVRAWIRGQILDKARDGLLKDDAREKITAGLERGLSKIFDDLSRSFERSAQQLVRDTEYNAKKTDDEAARVIQQGGTAEQVAREVERLTAIKERADANLDALERLADTLRSAG